MMRIFILVLAFMAAVSCNEVGDLAGNGGNPLDDCVITEAVQPGMEAVVQWNGFDESAVIRLIGEDGAEHEAEVSVVTSSGLIFRVPADLPAGTYAVVLDQLGNRQELGQIEVLAAELPVTGVKFPSAVEPGQPFIMEGTGFAMGHVLLLVKDGESVVLRQETVSSGLRVTVPDGTACGIYSLYLSDGSNEWLLSDCVSVAVRKTLRSVSRTSGYDGTIRYRTSYDVEYDGDMVAAVVFTASLTEDGEVLMEEARDRYVLGPDGVFRAEGGSSSSLNINFGYERDASGQIMSADVLRFSRNNPDGAMRTFSYVYDSAGRPEKVTYVLDDVTRSLQVYFYEDDNLVETMNSVFAYEDGALRNNPFAADVVMGYDMMLMTDEPFLYFPYLMGEHPFTSSLLPTAVLEPTGVMGALERKEVAYETDEDGYVVHMSWEAGASELFFEYE